jgi:hypothetical protein
MQLTPACGWLKNALLPDGHPNLTQDSTDPLWATSVFNPVVNVGEGIRALAVNRAELKKTFPGCTEPQYTRMALGGFNQGSNAITGCNQMRADANGYVLNVLAHYRELALAAGWTNPYE